MGVPGNADLLLLRSAAAAGGYQVERSLRFNAPDSAFLSRTPGSAGNRKTWTFAAWIKGPFNATDFPRVLNVEGPSAGNRTTLRFTSGSLIEAYSYDGSNFQWQLTSSQVFRDPSAWFHLVLAVDTTQATSSNRVKFYVNGVQVTAFSTASYPSLNFDTGINHTSPHTIGGGQALSAYLADVFLIDGQQLDPSSFVETSATTGQLIPKAYSGSFGTNGFWLKFSDNSAATATTLGKDYSGNSNNWTPNNLSVTAGAGNDSLVDTPSSAGTDTGLGGQVTGNYCTANPLAIGGGTLSNGNLDYVRVSDPGGNTCGKVLTTIATNTGKWYFEYTVATSSTSSAAIGITSNISGTASAIGGTNYVGIASYEYCWRAQGQTINNGSYPSYGTAATNGDVIMCAFDVDAGKVWFGRNGTWFNSSSPSAGTSPAFSGFSGTVMPIFGIGTASAGFDANGSINFGQRPFAYTAPSGFKALCDTNLPAPVVAKSSDYFQTVLYTGNGSTQTVSGLSFSPDLVWIKRRSSAISHALLDTVRGTNKVLYSNLTAAEDTYTDTLTAFNSDGFTLGSDATWGGVNASSSTYVAWAFDAGSNTVSNTAGSITSSVRANASAGFSIVTFTAPSSGNFTVGHGLNVTPQFMIIKGRDSNSSGYNWRVFHSSVCDTVRKMLALNTTDAIVVSGSDVWGSALPTSTVFGATAGNTVGGNGTAIAYCFSPVVGYSSFGSYTGNGSADGPFVFTGFKTAFVMLKTSSAAGDDWYLYDYKREAEYNPTTKPLFPNGSYAEQPDSRPVDLLSNGFKIRNQYWFNANGATVIYCAFAQNPFQYARAR